MAGMLRSGLCCTQIAFLFRKSSNDEETVTLAKSLIKAWKKLVPETGNWINKKSHEISFVIHLFYFFLLIIFISKSLRLLFSYIIVCPTFLAEKKEERKEKEEVKKKEEKEKKKEASFPKPGFSGKSGKS